jgi:integrase
MLGKHKTEHETGSARIIHLTLEVVAMCQELAERYPQGPLFRTAQGKPFPPGYYLARLVRRLRQRLGIRGIIPYGYRHSFATDTLANGVPDAQVAELLGHSGTTMLHKHYAHLTARAKALRDALNRVRPAAG